MADRGIEDLGHLIPAADRGLGDLRSALLDDSYARQAG